MDLRVLLILARCPSALFPVWEWGWRRSLDLMDQPKRTARNKNDLHLCILIHSTIHSICLGNTPTVLLEATYLCRDWRVRLALPRLGVET